jgi:hypothetical protein
MRVFESVDYRNFNRVSRPLQDKLRPVGARPPTFRHFPARPRTWPSARNVHCCSAAFLMQSERTAGWPLVPSPSFTVRHFPWNQTTVADAGAATSSADESAATGSRLVSDSGAAPQAETRARDERDERVRRTNREGMKDSVGGGGRCRAVAPEHLACQVLALRFQPAISGRLAIVRPRFFARFCAHSCARPRVEAGQHAWWAAGLMGHPPSCTGRSRGADLRADLGVRARMRGSPFARRPRGAPSPSPDGRLARWHRRCYWGRRCDSFPCAIDTPWSQ